VGNGLCGTVATVGVSLDDEVVGCDVGLADGPPYADVADRTVGVAVGLAAMDSLAVGDETGELSN